MLLNFINPFLCLETSFKPLLVSLNLFSLFSSLVLFLNNFLPVMNLILNIFSLILVCILWWKNIYIESILGFHTSKLELTMRSGMAFFILSEVFFFISFFWAFFDASISPSIDIGLSWPPLGILSLSLYSVPLLNTILLLTSGLSVTWAHHALLSNFYLKSIQSVFLTISLGAYFMFMQYEEYCESSFSMSDGVYGSTFFMATGFHGFHVFMGSIMLASSLFLLLKGSLLFNHHFSFELAAWYWHFVDVVWLFLFVSIYWWGGL